MKEKRPKILSVKRTDSYVQIRREVASETEQKTVPKKPGETVTKLVTSTSEFEETSHEAPLPAFDEALQELAGVVCNVLGLPLEWKKGLSVTGLSLSYTKSGVRSAVISAVKSLDVASASHPIKTQSFQIDDSKNPNEGRRHVAEKHAKAVIAAIKQVERYANGERSQTLLNFKDRDDDDGDKADGQIVGIFPGMSQDQGE